jgi:tryptophan synthase alpha subunit
VATKSLLEKSLATIKAGDYPALMTHVVLGYPSLEKSIELVQVMAENGAAIIELQIPFSDPMADGPSIMGACEHALSEGVTPLHCLDAMSKLSSKIDTPLLFMSYYNLVLNQKGFAKAASDAGCEGLIVPDITPGESKDSFFTECESESLPVIPLVSPITSETRMKQIASNSVSAPFVYCVSTTGTTGARDKLPEELPSYLENVKKHFPIPRALGFGISEKKHIEQLQGNAEIAIVGSAVINLIKESSNPNNEVANFIQKLSQK